ncbi:MAG: CocE/NonD family hydrolase [Pseudomonadota bacterium]
MAPRPRSEALTIAGPAGSLEAIVERPELADGASPRGAAVICHPHPQHGGAMTNKVTYTLARAFVLSGFAAVRFNFRGVGESEGAYAEGIGELADTLSVIDWARAEWAVPSVALAGFSFGAAMSVLASNARELTQLTLVAPPVGRILDPETRLPAGLATLVVQGGQDDVVDPDAVLAWTNAQAPGLRVAWLEDAGHFFHGKLTELREALVTEITARAEGSDAA